MEGKMEFLRLALGMVLCTTRRLDTEIDGIAMKWQGAGVLVKNLILKGPVVAS
jgi:hypothetical protein